MYLPRQKCQHTQSTALVAPHPPPYVPQVPGITVLCVPRLCFAHEEHHHKGRNGQEIHPDEGVCPERRVVLEVPEVPQHNLDGEHDGEDKLSPHPARTSNTM